jgi:hypothetical protein
MRLGDKRKVALLLFAAGVCGGAAPVPDASVPTRESKTLLERCDAHKFETIISVTVDGQPHRSRMRLCGVEGQSDADWIGTLKDAVDKTAANEAMPKPVRDQVIAALNAEILRLSAAKAEPVVQVPGPALDLTKIAPRPRPATPPAPVANDYAALPALPAAPTAETPHYIAPNAPLLARPRMALSCYSPGDIGDSGSCIEIGRETMLTVRADEDMPAGTSIRFIRNGERRADVQLAELKRGKSLRFALPREVCAGVAGAKLEVQVVRSAPGIAVDGQVVGREGSYYVHC